MVLDAETIILFCALLAAVLALFFGLLRLSNKIVAEKLRTMLEAHKKLEKEHNKIVLAFMESKKETEKKLQALEKETQKIEAQQPVQKELAVAMAKHKK